MPEEPAPRSLDRSPELVVASVYTREIGASLERVWENVYDWEHLPWLHSEAFGEIERLASGGWGWHARVGLRGGGESEIELVTDEPGRRYVARTLTGRGAPTEIWTALDPTGPDTTAIRVEFCVPPRESEQALRHLGEQYVSLYTLLWSQDEEMMQGRESALTEGPVPAAGGAVVALGDLEALRARLPLIVEHGGRSFRVVEVDGELLAHAVRCPHLLGPLDECGIVDGRIVCPWHGYAFDVRTGASADGRGLRLAAAPRVEVDPASGEVRLRAREPSEAV